MRSPKVVALVVMGISLPCAAPPIWACDMSAPADWPSHVEQEFDRAALVFLGTSQSTRRHDVTGQLPADPLAPIPPLVWNSIEVQFSVERVWKGNAAELVSLRTASDGACGTGHDIGQQYIVFAYAIPNENELYIETGSTYPLSFYRSMFAEVLELLEALE